VTSLVCDYIDCSFCLFYLTVFNATCNNISVISWQSVLLVEENGVPVEKHRPITVNDALVKGKFKVTINNSTDINKVNK
jgi:hypothetical protein